MMMVVLSMFLPTMMTLSRRRRIYCLVFWCITLFHNTFLLQSQTTIFVNSFVVYDDGGRSRSLNGGSKQVGAALHPSPLDSYLSRKRIQHPSTLSLLSSSWKTSTIVTAHSRRSDVGTLLSMVSNETSIEDNTNKRRKSKASTSSNSKEPTRRINSNVRSIMDLLMRRYPTTPINGSQDVSNTTCEWSKTRNYIYKVSDSLSIEQVRDVINYLDSIVDNPKETTKMILQATPRILKRSVTNSIKPTAEFLVELWGDELFQLAIQKNPKVLLSQGLGYGDGPEKEQIQHYLYSTLVGDIRKNNNNDKGGISIGESSSSSLIQKLQKSAPFLFVSTLKQVQDVMEYLITLLVQPPKITTDDDDDDDAMGGIVLNHKLRTQLTKIVTSHPQLFKLSVENNLKPRVNYIMDRCSMNQTDIASLISKSSCGGAGILGLSVSDNLQPTIDYIANKILQLQDVDKADNQEPQVDQSLLRKVILSHPPLLGLSLKNLQNKVAYFNAIDEIAAAQEGKKKRRTPSSSSQTSLSSRVAIRAPAVYSLSLRDNIIPTIEFLSKIWGKASPIVHWNDDKKDDRKMTITLPPPLHYDEQEDTDSSFSIHTRSVESPIRASSETAESKIVDASATVSLASLLGEYPSILTLSLVGNIQPTMNFYNRTGYTGLTSDWELIPNKGTVSLIRGRYIAASLYNRLLPRYHYCYSKGTLVAPPPVGSDNDSGENAKETNSPSSGSAAAFAIPPLHLMVSATDDGFCDAHGFDFKDFSKFKEDAIPRLKFSSQFDTWLKTGRPIEV